VDQGGGLTAMPSLIVWPRDWTPRRAPDLAAAIDSLVATHRRREWSDAAPALLLLPACVDAPFGTLEEAAAALREPARRHRLFVAGAVRVAAGPGAGFATVGFLVGDDGELRIAAPKRSPDLVEGVAEGATLQSATGPVICATPIGQVAVLPGEDVLFPQLVRAATFAGAEVVLNPAVEVGDELAESRRVARRARAWENTGCLASACAAGPGAGEARIASALVVDWNGVEQAGPAGDEPLFVDLDPDRLRRRRDSIFAVQPLHLRARLYADGYRRLIARAGAPASPPRSRAQWQAEAQRRLAAQPAPPRPAGFVEQYDVILGQTVTRIIQRESDVVAQRLSNVRAALKLAGRLAGNPGSKLVVFGEFFMHGQGGHGYRSPITLQRLAIRYPGPELELLQDFALRHKTFVAGSSFEIDDRFPGHVFNSAFILDDSGELIHRYRKIQCADVWGSLPDTTPSSVYQRYLDTYGYDFLFPVANTRIGRLGTMVCFDQAHPEVAGLLARMGAEVIIHPSSEGHGSGRHGWDAARRARAFENTAYVLSALPGGEYFDPDSDDLPTAQMRGHSKIVGFDGAILGEADSAGPCVLTGTIDLRALQRARANPRVHLALWDDPAAYVAAYESGVGLPNDLWGTDPLDNPYRGFGPLKRVLADYYARGIFVAPEGRAQGAAAPLPGRLAAAAAPAAGVAPGATRLADQGRIDGEHIQV
jgi:predicted amidohydrolase